MTLVKAGRDREGFFIEAAGHSGYDIAGRDVVCAAISALIFTTIIMTEKMESAGYLRQRTADIHEGYVKVTAHAVKGKREKLQTVFETALAGLELLESEFPGYLKILK